MTLTLLAISVAIAGVIVVLWAKRRKNESELDRHSISAEHLQSMMASGQNVFSLMFVSPSICWPIRSLFLARRGFRLKTCSINRLSFLEMKISLSTVPVPVIRPAEWFWVARWRLGLPGSSCSQADWRLGKRRDTLWNPIGNPFGFRFQPGPGRQVSQASKL